jgi:hypothetical protein
MPKLAGKHVPSHLTSTVDYAIVSENVLESILYFKVNNLLPTLSDCHCPIEWQMSASFMESVAKTETTKNSFPLRYIWSDDSAHAFQQALASSKIQSFVSEFVSITSMNDDNSINTASEYYIHLACSMYSSLINHLIFYR